MIDPQTYYLFFLTALVLVLSPGPDMALILSRTLASGRSAGILTLLGTQTGIMLHALLAGLGVSSVILLLPQAFDILKYFGAAYLVFLAVMTWRAPVKMELDGDLKSGDGTALRYFYQGLVNNLVNPKMIPFFIALFPQFIRTENGAVALQSILLGTTLVGIAIVWLGALVLLIGRIRPALASSAGFLKLVNRLAAFIFVGLACLVLVER
jgi:threonine/homoserine/homoserine lactone efflux protein